MELMEEKKVEAQGELQREIGSVRNELKCLRPLENNLEVLLEKMEILDKVDRAMQRMGESGHPNCDRGKERGRETVVQQPTSHILESSGVSSMGVGFEAFS